MDAKKDKKEKLEKIVGSKVTKLVLITLAVAIFLIIAGSILYFPISDKLSQSKAQEFEAVQKTITDFKDKNIGTEETVLAAIDAYTTRVKRGSYVAEAFFSKATILLEKKELVGAKEAFFASAGAAKNYYLTPVALENCAVLLENEGNSVEALNTLKQIDSKYSNYFNMVRVYFNLGRLSEPTDIDQAIGFYTKGVKREESKESDWAKLCQSRIIYLQSSQNDIEAPKN